MEAVPDDDDMLLLAHLGPTTQNRCGRTVMSKNAVDVKWEERVQVSLCLNNPSPIFGHAAKRLRRWTWTPRHEN